MARSDDSSSRNRSSWRGSAAPRVTSTGTARRRWGWLLLSLTLLASILYVLISFFFARARTHVVTVVTREVRGLESVPPILFAREDLQPLERYPRLAPLAAVDQLSSSQLDELGNRLARLKIARKDCLVLYVSAQGIVRDGEPFLIDQDFDVRDNPSAAFSLEQLLTTLDDCPAATKLLVLDAGNIVSDPTVGLPFNYFPVAAADKVQSHADDRLWVILSHGPGQIACVSLRDRHSIFGQSFVDGITGAADGAIPTSPVRTQGGPEQDRKVTLGELYAYVLTTCQRRTQGLQIPLLIQGGQKASELDWGQLAIEVARVRAPAPAASGGANAANPPDPRREAPPPVSTESPNETRPRETTPNATPLGNETTKTPAENAGASVQATDHDATDHTATTSTSSEKASLR